MQHLEIFRYGKHTAMSGQTLHFSEFDIQDIVNNYDPNLYDAPLVVGHPRTDDPAYGWVSEVYSENGILKAIPSDVDADFSELVRQKKFKKISASFYTPDSPQNPTPGSYYLRHVGFLGATPPAVKGLKSASFSEREKGVLVFEFGEDLMETEKDQEIAELKRQLKRNESLNFVEKLVSKGKILPIQKDDLVEFIASLNNDSMIEFSESGLSQETWFKNFLENLPEQVHFGEIVRENFKPEMVNFSAPPRYDVDRGRLSLYNKAIAYQGANNVSFEDAVKAVGG